MTPRHSKSSTSAPTDSGGLSPPSCRPQCSPGPCSCPPISSVSYPPRPSKKRPRHSTARCEQKPPAESDLAQDYAYLCLAFVLWPLVAVALAKAFGVAQTYSRYII